MENSQWGVRPNLIHFEIGNLSITEVARALRMDKQTVRILIQSGLVSWGKAVKKPGSTHYLYLISPRKFYEETGVLLGAQMPDEYEIWERQQTDHSDDASFFRYTQNRMDNADSKADLSRRGMTADA